MLKPFNFTSFDQDLAIEREQLCKQGLYYQSLFAVIEQAFTNKEVPARVNWYKRKNRAVNLLRQVLAAIGYQLKSERKYQGYVDKKRIYQTQYRVVQQKQSDQAYTSTLPIDLE